MIEKINDIMKNKEVKEMLKMYENFSWLHEMFLAFPRGLFANSVF